MCSFHFYMLLMLIVHALSYSAAVLSQALLEFCYQVFLLWGLICGWIHGRLHFSRAYFSMFLKSDKIVTPVGLSRWNSYLGIFFDRACKKFFLMEWQKIRNCYGPILGTTDNFHIVECWWHGLSELWEKQGAIGWVDLWFIILTYLE